MTGGQTNDVEPDDAEALDLRIAQALERQRQERAKNPLSDTPLWLSHHWPSRYDRCAFIRGKHICRRCLVLYPIAICVALIAGAGLTWPRAWDPWMFWFLPLPGVVEFVCDVMGIVRHRPWRQVAVSALLAVAYGKMLWRYSHHPGDPLVWTVILVQTGICGIAAMLAIWLRRSWIDQGDDPATVGSHD